MYCTMSNEVTLTGTVEITVRSESLGSVNKELYEPFKGGGK